ncbi:hypothetical protein [Cellulomonas fimi]|uniref:hypothetical protein n=1 Tax=Cellulomonas fimi TaxID=1708 RepID=UPI002358494D|nr:hypothetical protein [Cellulomonas fimi]
MHPALDELNLSRILAALAVRRPVFHSEADLQQELAWQVHLEHSTADVRLEVRVPEPSRPGRRERVDVLLRTSLGRVAIELKYPTDALTAVVDGELFELPRQGAQDITAYDVVKDVHRVEHFVRTGLADAGAVIVVSNDRSYWSDPGHGRTTAASAFRLYESTTLSGLRAWGVTAGAGTTRGREDALDITGTHTLAWGDYSTLEGAARGRFRVLLISIVPPGKV